MSDLISRQAAIDALCKAGCESGYCGISCDDVKAIEQLPSAQPHWIPCREALPKDTKPVNITWVNHGPEPYYADIKDKPFTSTGCYCKGKWYWYSVTCEDYLDEYGYNDVDSMDEEIEVIAWMPLPESYKGEQDG